MEAGDETEWVMTPDTEASWQLREILSNNAIHNQIVCSSFKAVLLLAVLFGLNGFRKPNLFCNRNILFLELKNLLNNFLLRMIYYLANKNPP